MVALIPTRGKLKVAATGSAIPLAQRVTTYLNEYLIKDIQDGHRINGNSIYVDAERRQFGDSEIKDKVADSVRGADLYVFCDCYSSIYPNSERPYSVDDNLRALKTLIDSAAREANHVTAVVPTFPYSRQERRIGRDPISAQQIAREIEAAGAKQVITFDIHNPAIAGFFVGKVPLEDLYASRNLIDKFREDFSLERTVVTSPDAGGVKRAEKIANTLQTRLAIIHKDRDYRNGDKITKMILIGNVVDYDIAPLDKLQLIREIVENENVPFTDGYKRIQEILDSKSYPLDVLLVDDMAATCGTMRNALETLKKNGARNISVAVTHAILNGKERDLKTGLWSDEIGMRNIVDYHKSGLLHKFYYADIINHGEFAERNADFVVPVSVDKYLAKVIYSLNTFNSLSKLLDRTYKIQ